MTDNQLFRLLLPLIYDGMRAVGVADLSIKQQYQPTQQGMPSGPTIFLHKISDYRYGYPQRKSIWNLESKKFIHKESIWMQTSFQVNALALQGPEQPDLQTASDLLNLSAIVLQSDATRQALQKHEIGIYRVQAIRQIYFTNDREQFEASPSFDFTLTHKHTITSCVPLVDTFEQKIYRV